MVGRMYSEVPGRRGIHSRSSRTISRIAWRISTGSGGGMHRRGAPFGHAGDVAIQAEDAQLAVVPAERLQAVEQALAVVQTGGGR